VEVEGLRSLRFIGIELKSMPQFIVLLLLAPAIMSYLVWDKLASVTISVGSTIFPVPPNYNIQTGILINITKRTGIFMNFSFAQWEAFYIFLLKASPFRAGMQYS